MNLKELFEKSQDGKLSYEDFKKLVGESKAKFVDLSEGGYVSKGKYDDDLAAKDDEINLLNASITQRETDLADLQTKLKDAGDNIDKLKDIDTQFETLKSQYETDVDNYRNMLEDQKYEFAVKEYANSKKFSSNAAKRDFINVMLDRRLQMEDNSILGADDFTNKWMESNADAFIVETPPVGQSTSTPKPEFINPTPGTDIGANKEPKDEFVFNFTPINKKD